MATAGVASTAASKRLNWPPFSIPLHGSRLLVVYNPAEQRRTTVISVVVDCPDAGVVDAESGRPMAAQISAVWEEPNRASAEKFQVNDLWSWYEDQLVQVLFTQLFEWWGPNGS